MGAATGAVGGEAPPHSTFFRVLDALRRQPELGAKCISSGLMNRPLLHQLRESLHAQVLEPHVEPSRHVVLKRDHARGRFAGNRLTKPNAIYAVDVVDQERSLGADRVGIVRVPSDTLLAGPGPRHDRPSPANLRRGPPNTFVPCRPGTRLRPSAPRRRPWTDTGCRYSRSLRRKRRLSRRSPRRYRRCRREMSAP